MKKLQFITLIGLFLTVAFVLAWEGTMQTPIPVDIVKKELVELRIHGVSPNYKMTIILSCKSESESVVEKRIVTTDVNEFFEGQEELVTLLSARLKEILVSKGELQEGDTWE